MVQRWTFQELGGLNEQYTVAVNPHDGGSPANRRNMYIASRSGPGGTPIVQAGRLEVQSLQFSGSIISQAHYLAMDKWSKKNSTIQLTDDLGRTYIGIFSEFTPTRQKRASNFWKHEYTATFTVTGLAPQGVSGATTAAVFYVKDTFTRPSAGSGASLSTINTIFGNEELSGQPWINSTSSTNAYNNIAYTGGGSPTGNAYRQQGSTQNFYCYTGVKVIQNGDLLVSASFTIKSLAAGGRLGLYARNQSTTPAQGDVGGGYIIELVPSTSQIQIAKIGGGTPFATKTLSYTISNATTYVMSFRLYGGSLALYLSPASGADPFYSNGLPSTTPELTVSDFTYSNPGYCGFTTYGVDCANTDNFSARGL